MAKKGPQWIRFLRHYGPNARNDNMYDEHIRASAMRSNLSPLLFKHPIEDELLALFSSSAESPTSVILTGTAGDGKTHLCRQVWIQLGGDPDQWESDDVYFHIDAYIAGELTTVHIVRDLTGLPETGKTGGFMTKTELLESFSYTIFDKSAGSVFLIAANDGQLVDTWARLNESKKHIDDTRRLLESLLFNDHREETGTRLKLFNLSRISSAELFDRSVNAFISHEGWQHCKDEAESDNELFGAHCPIRHNYEILKSNQIRLRLRALLELCDHNEIHLSIRRILMLLSNSVLGFSGNEAAGKRVEDRLLRAVDVPRVIESGQVAKASIYNNIFGGNLTEHRRNSHDIYEQLGRFRIGHETSNRVDNLLIYGDSDIELKKYFDQFLTNDAFYGADANYRAYQMLYLEGAEDNDADTERFLELLVAQRRGLFFKIPDTDSDEFSPWCLTVFTFAGEYLDRVLTRLRQGKRIEKSVLARLTQGLNRIFIGMLVSSEHELWLATGLSGSHAKVSFILEDRVSVSRRAKEFVTVTSNSSGFPLLQVSFDDGLVVDLKLTLTRFEFLSRVAEGVLPGSFSKECHEDILAFKSRLLSAAKQRRGEQEDDEGGTEFRLVELDETGYPRENTVELDV
ncbi:hypothetical protein V6x_52030 [Gimesia chilikensis]|uniref:Uncharacterized protein n=1 Tax=Gimesia chilikensis TaxID=2605989 RepID=A0A517WJM7_9PLAN|nr:hypothetical protein [Gimesia chilikensis]QDU05466.1 hypothetical protein V6x_52030 [Gimesia chilikensis]